MSAAQFTPPPWFDNLHAGEKRDGGRFYVHVLAKAAGIVPVACVPTGVEGHGREEGRANARLIAAAPELYEALKRARSVMIEFDHYSEDGPEIRNIDAALNKAAGQ